MNDRFYTGMLILSAVLLFGAFIAETVRTVYRLRALKATLRPIQNPDTSDK